MKILVLQLARYGDIYQTWPVLRSLYRNNTQCEIHIVVRKRFSSALEGIGIPIVIHELDTGSILKPIIEKNEEGILDSSNQLNSWILSFETIVFDKIINLSFSPASSYLVDLIAFPETKVSGYSRTLDGYLSLPDDSSAYFYGQVGIGKSNRAHLIEIFASIAGVELEEQDWGLSDYSHCLNVKENIFKKSSISTSEEFIIIHISASNLNKTPNWTQWAEIIYNLKENYTGNIILVGGSEDTLIAERMIKNVKYQKLYNLVGKTSLYELLCCLPFCKLAIGGDSVVMQMCNLAKNEAFNLSFDSVNFWETGPLEIGSRVLILRSPHLLDCKSIANEIYLHLENSQSDSPIAICNGESPVHYIVENKELSDDFQWDLIRAIYMGEQFPPVPSDIVLHGFLRLFELSDLALKQMSSISKEKARGLAANILEQVDGLINSVGNMVPELIPLISWFKVEQIRVGPSDMSDLIQNTEKNYASLKMICELYLGNDLGERPGSEVNDESILDNRGH